MTYAARVSVHPLGPTWLVPLLALLVCAGLALGLVWSVRSSSVPQLSVVRPPAADLDRASRCPPRTLEDEGVCLPVPSARVENAEARIAKLPERPSELSAYRLPVAGQSQWVNLELAEVPLLFRSEGQALVVNTTAGQALRASDFAPFNNARLVAYSSSGGWLLLAPEVEAERPAQLVLIAGLVELTPQLVPGTGLPQDRVLARTARSLWLAARQVLPSRTQPFSVKDWQDNASVAQDLRNLLPLAETPPAASASIH